VTNRDISAWPQEKLRRSRVAWEDTLPADIAAKQVRAEREATAHAMRASGEQWGVIAARYGVSTERVRQLVSRHERRIKGGYKMPAQAFIESAEPMIGKVTVSEMAYLRRLVL
jgi:hypothetical protein